MQPRNRAPVVALALVSIAVVFVPLPSQAQDGLFQLEGHVLERPALRFGVRLGERAVVLTGVEADFGDHDYGGSTTHFGSWAVPLEAKLYFGDTRAGAVVPLALLGGSYGRSVNRFEIEGTPSSGLAGLSPQATEVNAAAAYWLVGVDYFVTDAFAIELAGGPYYRHEWLEGDSFAGLGGLAGSATGGDTSQRGWGVTWRLGVVLRP